MQESLLSDPDPLLGRSGAEEDEKRPQASQDPYPATQGALQIVHIGDPFTWDRSGARIAGKPPKQFISFYTTKEARERSKQIGDLWIEQGLPRYHAHVPMRVEVTAVFMRPGTHFGTGRNSNLLKPSKDHSRPGKGGGRTHGPDGSKHATGGDLDNLSKICWDALNDVAFHDDGQIAECANSKLYVDQALDLIGPAVPRTIIAVEPLGILQGWRCTVCGQEAEGHTAEHPFDPQLVSLDRA